MGKTTKIKRGKKKVEGTLYLDFQGFNIRRSYLFGKCHRLDCCKNKEYHRAPLAEYNSHIYSLVL